MALSSESGFAAGRETAAATQRGICPVCGTPVLGSPASCILSGLGTSSACAGDTVALTVPGRMAPTAFAAPAPHVGTVRSVRVLPGPHADLFAADA